MIRDLTGIQWRDLMTSVMWSCFLVCVMSRAALCWRSCRRWMSLSGKPKSSELQLSSLEVTKEWTSCSVARITIVQSWGHKKMNKLFCSTWCLKFDDLSNQVDLVTTWLTQCAADLLLHAEMTVKYYTQIFYIRAFISCALMEMCSQLRGNVDGITYPRTIGTCSKHFGNVWRYCIRYGLGCDVCITVIELCFNSLDRNLIQHIIIHMKFVHTIDTFHTFLYISSRLEWQKLTYGSIEWIQEKHACLLNSLRKLWVFYRRRDIDCLMSFSWKWVPSATCLCLFVCLFVCIVFTGKQGRQG